MHFKNFIEMQEMCIQELENLFMNLFQVISLQFLIFLPPLRRANMLIFARLLIP